MAVVSRRTSWPSPRTSRYVLRVLGRFELAQGRNVITTGQAEQRLLALLVVRCEASRVEVAGLLWPDAEPDRAQGNLRTTLWRLTQRCRAVLVTDRERLALSAAVSTDVEMFEAWAGRLLGRSAVADDDLVPHACGGGELLPGWYEDWVIFERERLRELRLHAMDALARELGRRGMRAAGIDVAMEAVRIDPLRESTHRTLIGLHLEENNLAEALRHLEFVTRLLRTELGVRPSPRLMALVRSRVPLPADAIRSSSV